MPAPPWPSQPAECAHQKERLRRSAPARHLVGLVELPGLVQDEGVALQAPGTGTAVCTKFACTSSMTQFVCTTLPECRTNSIRNEEEKGDFWAPLASMLLFPMYHFRSAAAGHCSTLSPVLYAACYLLLLECPLLQHTKQCHLLFSKPPLLLQPPAARLHCPPSACMWP